MAIKGGCPEVKSGNSNRTMDKGENGDKIEGKESSPVAKRRSNTANDMQKHTKKIVTSGSCEGANTSDL